MSIKRRKPPVTSEPEEHGAPVVLDLDPKEDTVARILVEAEVDGERREVLVRTRSLVAARNRALAFWGATASEVRGLTITTPDED